MVQQLRKAIVLVRSQEPEALAQVWQVIHLHDMIISPEKMSLLEEINPDRFHSEVTLDGRVARLLKSW